LAVQQQALAGAGCPSRLRKELDFQGSKSLTRPFANFRTCRSLDLTPALHARRTSPCTVSIPARHPQPSRQHSGIQASHTNTRKAFLLFHQRWFGSLPEAQSQPLSVSLEVDHSVGTFPRWEFDQRPSNSALRHLACIAAALCGHSGCCRLGFYWLSLTFLTRKP
jgi:hypothetical protein